MFRIGDFSKICQVSIKTLRHWNEVGLLQPARTDPRSGYRYYTIDQLETVNRIIALKGMGLSLKQITDLLQENLSPQDIRAMLLLKRAEITQQLEQGQMMLQMVESRLTHIEQRGTLPGYDTVLKSIAEQDVVAIRETTSSMSTLVDLLRETYGHIQPRDRTGLVVVFHDEGYHNENLDIEIGFTADVDAIPLADGRSMSRRRLPELEQVASTVHTGPWLTLSQGYAFLGTWIANNGYRIVGPGREVFHHIDWENNNQTTVTELMFPVARP